MALLLPNSTAYLTATFPAYSATQDMTVMCWGLLNTPNTGSYRNFVTVEPNLALQTFSDGVTFDAGTATTDNNGSVLNANTWYHVTETFRCTTATNRRIKGYINGQQNVDVTDTSTFSAYTGIVVGYDTTLGSAVQAFNGLIRDVRVWSRELNAQEIALEMKSPRPVNTKALVIWSTFDTDFFTDDSGNGKVWSTGGTGAASIATVAGPLIAYPSRNAKLLR